MIAKKSLQTDKIKTIFTNEHTSGYKRCRQKYSIRNQQRIACGLPTRDNNDKTKVLNTGATYNSITLLI